MPCTDPVCSGAGTCWRCFDPVARPSGHPFLQSLVAAAPPLLQSRQVLPPRLSTAVIPSMHHPFMSPVLQPFQLTPVPITSSAPFQLVPVAMPALGPNPLLTMPAPTANPPPTPSVSLPGEKRRRGAGIVVAEGMITGSGVCFVCQKPMGQDCNKFFDSSTKTNIPQLEALDWTGHPRTELYAHTRCRSRVTRQKDRERNPAAVEKIVRLHSQRQEQIDARFEFQRKQLVSTPRITAPGTSCVSVHVYARVSHGSAGMDPFPYR
jgi:hypothetical protein